MHGHKNAKHVYMVAILDLNQSLLQNTGQTD